MSAVENEAKSVDDIIALKQKAKKIENEVVDYKFGFDAIPRSSTSSQSHNTKQQDYVPPVSVSTSKIREIVRWKKRKNYEQRNRPKIKRSSTFIETDIEQSFPVQTEHIKTPSGLADLACPIPSTNKVLPLQNIQNVDATEKEQNSRLGSRFETASQVNVDSIQNIGSNIDLINEDYIMMELSDEQNDTAYIFSDKNSYLNSGEDNFELILSDTSNERVPPLLFQKYFKVLESKDDSIRAMCQICGFDENGKPKNTRSAKQNVTSNLVTHLKVGYLNFQ